MAGKTKKAIQSESNLYYFAHTFHSDTMTYIAGVGYELTQEQIAEYIKHVEIGTCPKISHSDCGCNK